ncbi:hypothetical protein ACFXKJ_41590, partial [Kitasatospora indigofera]|uniref:hypothetical protein n=1 Tax=Kitasatospora indigofera TaxID=67307 RepID=UPI00369B2205
VLGKQTEERVAEVRERARGVLAEVGLAAPGSWLVDQVAYLLHKNAGEAITDRTTAVEVLEPTWSPLVQEPQSVGSDPLSTAFIVGQVPMHPADLALADRMAGEPPLAELRARFEARSAEEQASLLAAADRLVHLRPLIENEGTAVFARHLHNALRLRVVEAFAEGPDQGKALAARLSPPHGRLLGGAPQAEDQHTALMSSEETGTSAAVANVWIPTAKAVATGVIFPGADTIAPSFSGLYPNLRRLVVLLPMDSSGQPLGTRPDGTVSVMGAAELARAIAHAVPGKLITAEIIQVYPVGQTPDNAAAVRRLMEQLADVTRRSVWLPGTDAQVVVDGALRLITIDPQKPGQWKAGQWEETIPPDGWASAWSTGENGELVRRPDAPEIQQPTWANHVLADSAQLGQVVLAATITRSGELRIPMADGLLAPPRQTNG